MYGDISWFKDFHKRAKAIVSTGTVPTMDDWFYEKNRKTLGKVVGNNSNFSMAVTTMLLEEEMADHPDIEKLIEHAIITKCDALMVNMYTYIKDVHYRIDPPEPCKPVAMVRAKVPIDGIRGSGIRNKEIAPVYMHHFTGVRDDMTEITTKLELSNAADGNRPVKDWMSKIWDRLPHGENLHWTAGCEHYWKRILVINDEDLPEALFQ
jgi:hypothetical protein